MRNWKQLLLAGLLALAPLSSATAQQAGNATERLEQLGRIWVYFDYFNPYLGIGDTDWDQALFDAIPAVRAARSEADYISAVNAMLARSGDPAARIVADETEQGAPPPSREQGGAVITTCAGLTHALAQEGANPASVAADLAARPTVVDCRDLQDDYYHSPLRGLFAAIASTRTSQVLPAGASLMRSYSGFPPQTGSSSGGYSSGVTAVDNGVVEAGTPLEAAPLAFLIDESFAEHLPALAALQAAGKVRIVSTSDVGSGFAFINAGDLTVRMSRGVYVYPNGAVGFRADAVPTGDAAALDTAIAQLSAPPHSAAAPAAAPSLRPPVVRYRARGAPPVEQRLLALFRFWGTIQYFFPYRDLMDRPWEDALAEFIPAFLAADTREAYETAVMRLAVRTQDSHTGVNGLTAILYGVAPSRPAIFPRYVENRLVIAEIFDPALADRVSVGDEIVAIDGVPVATLEARLTPLIPHSTAQSLRLKLGRWIVSGPRDSLAVMRLRGADGRIRTVRLPRVASPEPPVESPAWRMLDGNVGYINLDDLPGADADRALDELMAARALILDLRGYPQGTAWTLAPRLARSDAPFHVARFRRSAYTRPPYEGEEAWVAFDQVFPAAEPARRYAGPVFVLIDELAFSQSEHSALMYEAATDVTFVGTPTTGANGDITGVILPGPLYVRFTGHDVRHPDGAQLQRVGIQPDVPVAPTIAGLRAGRDEVLEAALALARRAPESTSTPSPH